MRRSLLVSAVFAIALIVAAVSLGSAQKDTFRLVANLKARSEVPKPTGARPGVTGAFTGTAVELANDNARLNWRLTYSKLTGRAVAAHIHTGKVGKAGNVMVPLCGPCPNGKKGAVTITHAQLNTIRAGRAYVNIHTPKNPAGEIRGQVKVSLMTSDGSPPPPPSPVPPPPPPDPYP
jgi:CHRD domain